MLVKYLGKVEKTLGHGYDVFHLAHGVNAFFHCLRVLRTGTIENALDTFNLCLSPLAVRFTDSLRRIY